MRGLPRYVLLSGGVGGAKLALGLARVLEPGQLTVIGNTGDDFEHLGLSISPDLDTLMYTLAGVANPDTGWGCANETWSFMAAIEALGGDTWFRLGDRDLATHVERTRLRAAGQTLTAVTAHLCARLGVTTTLLPMSDARVRTVIGTTGGELPFQEYFVRQKAEPAVTSIRYEGAAQAPPAAAIAAVLTDPALRAIFIAPSNPFLSIDPILAIPSIGAAVRSATARVVGVSPLVGGKALKGPTAKMMASLGLPATSAAVAGHYRAALDGFILDSTDGGERGAIESMGISVGLTGTVMRTLEDRMALAEFALAFASQLR